MSPKLVLLVLGIVSYSSFAAGQTPSTQPLASVPDLGIGASFHGKRIFPTDNPWNKDVSKEDVDQNSAKIVASIGLDKSLHPDFGVQYGIPYMVVTGNEPRVPIVFTAYGGESDPGPYPIPLNAPIEGGASAPRNSDRHVLVLDRDNWKLYELYNAFPDPTNKRWRAAGGAIFDLSTNKLRPAGWTSSDAAGLPVLPGLVRYDEIVEQGELTHAVRFTVVRSRRAYVPPATHYAARRTDPNLPPMGMRVRLKASYDISGFPPVAQTILKGLKKYGMIVADNGGDWFVTGAPDPRWNDQEVDTLKRVHGRDFEVVKMEGLVTR